MLGMSLSLPALIGGVKFGASDFEAAPRVFWREARLDRTAHRGARIVQPSVDEVAARAAASRVNAPIILDFGIGENTKDAMVPE